MTQKTAKPVKPEASKPKAKTTLVPRSETGMAEKVFTNLGLKAKSAENAALWVAAEFNLHKTTAGHGTTRNLATLKNDLQRFVVTANKFMKYFENFEKNAGDNGAKAATADTAVPKSAAAVPEAEKKVKKAAVQVKSGGVHYHYP